MPPGLKHAVSWSFPKLSFINDKFQQRGRLSTCHVSPVNLPVQVRCEVCVQGNERGLPHWENRREGQKLANFVAKLLVWSSEFRAGMVMKYMSIYQRKKWVCWDTQLDCTHFTNALWAWHWEVSFHWENGQLSLGNYMLQLNNDNLHVSLMTGLP